MKVLAPVGNFESLKAAVLGGADEVYLGINRFNARNIDGFTLETLKEAVDYAHVFNIKVCLAVNILFSDDELQSALDLIIAAHNKGVDAIIIQDLGLAGLLHKHFPEIEIHASTQMGIHNLEGVKQIEKYGFSRVVLARETTLDEIKRIKECSNIEIEFFAHGALCVSFSGNCYLSSYLCDASGNRGKCKQLCRLPYSLLKNNKEIKSGYLLSAKDFCMIDRLEELKEAGVDVLKIEGRARRPFYVYTATNAYKAALNNKSFSKEQLQLAFNRTYTAGYFDGNNNIISSLQNHIGICIGVVKKVNIGKRFNEVVIESEKNINPKSGLKFFKNGKEIAVVSAYDIKKINSKEYLLSTTQKIPVGATVNLIQDVAKEDEILAAKAKRQVCLKLSLNRGCPIQAKVQIGKEELIVEGAVCQEAQTHPLTKEEVQQNFAKSDIFAANLSFENFESVFLTKKQLNDFRRVVFETVFEKLTTVSNKQLKTVKLKAPKPILKFEDFQVIESLDEPLLKTNIVYSPSEYLVKNVQKLQEICKKHGKNAFLDIPNFATKQDYAALEKIVKQTNIAIVANNYFALGLTKNFVVGRGLNVYNSYTAEFLAKPAVSAESSVSTKMVAEYMTMRHCPMKEHLNATCKNCPYSEGFVYKMENGKELKLKRKKVFSCSFYLTDWDVNKIIKDC